MKAKFINENKIEKLEGQNNYVIYQGMVYTNPEHNSKLPVSLEELGYKDLVVEEQPTYNPETQYLTIKYRDGEKITKSWEIVSIVL